MRHFAKRFVLWSLVSLAVSAFAAPEEAAEHNRTGAALVEQGRIEPAIVEFQKALASEPSYFPARLNLAFALEKAGRIEDAVAAYREAIDAQPRNFLAHNNLGVLYDKKGQYDLALVSFERALTIDPENSMALKNLEITKKNQAALKERERQILTAEKEAQAKAKDPQAAYKVARLYAFYGNKELALQWLSKAMRQGYGDLAGVKADPAFSNLREERDFELLLLRK